MPSNGFCIKQPLNSGIIEQTIVNVLLNPHNLDRFFIKSLIGGQKLNKLEAILAGLRRYKSKFGIPSHDLYALAVLAIGDYNFMKEFEGMMPKKIPFHKRDLKMKQTNEARMP